MRLNYLDALRGLAIFIVVYCHYIGFKLNLQYTSYITSFLTSFFIPLFFFISGYLAYKEDVSKKCEYFYKKTKSLLLPTIIILLISSYVWNGNFFNTIQEPGTKGGYWFTYILFQMFVIYGIIKILPIKNVIKNRYVIDLLYVIFFVIILIIYRLSFNTSVGNIMSSSMLYYNLVYFVLGVYCKKYNQIFHIIINHNVFPIIIFLFSFIDIFINVHYMFTNISRVLLVYMLFYKNRDWIDRNIIGKTLSCFGRFSLEIYFLHYFLLFTPPSIISDYLNGIYTSNNHGNEIMVSFVEFTIITPVIIYISYICIFIRKTISYFPFLSKMIFGR